MANEARVMGAIKNFLLKMKALDEAIPEDLAEDALEMTEEVKDALCEEETVKDSDLGGDNPVEDEEPVEEEEKVDIDKKVEDAFVKVMRKYGLIKDSAMASLDELETKLSEAQETEDVEGEEEVTVDPEVMNDSAKRELLRAIKPAIASVKDSKTRKLLADNFAKAIGGVSSTTSDYASIMQAVANNTRKAVSEKKQTVDHSVEDVDFGMEIAKRFNPHYMKEDK
jgi:hypothetical protein|nr:MAG TPA: hypothetical protein [Caudoviricetes sp.]